MGEGERTMLKCKICGCEFNATKEGHYVSRDEGLTGISAISGGTESKEYDTFDCPQCGCQNIAQPRKRAVKEK